MNTYLQEILKNKQTEVAQLVAELTDHVGHPLHAILSQSRFDDRKQIFESALSKPGLNVIAEIKRRSPSRQHIGDIVDPIALAKKYQQGGAAAISVLTDQKGFGGSLQDLENVTHAVPSLPALRKDFILSPLQIAQARLYGASAVLLIVAVLQEQIPDFLSYAKQFNLSAIVEVHTEEECALAVKSGANIIGINNRNLQTFETNLSVAENIKQAIPKHIIAIAESGIHTIEQAVHFHVLGFNAVLIGECLVKNTSPADFISALNAQTRGCDEN